jgi:hypothetical protein
MSSTIHLPKLQRSRHCVQSFSVHARKQGNLLQLSGDGHLGVTNVNFSDSSCSEKMEKSAACIDKF